MRFRDRHDAGAQLAERLEAHRAEHPVVLGLARGGVPVAAEVARALKAELDVLVIRKLGAPGCPEYAIGAIAEGGAVYVRRAAIDEVGLGEDEVEALAAREAIELARRVRAYRGERPMPDLAGRTVIVVDDGVATGATALAAARAARGRGASRVILAAPVIAGASAQTLRQEFDEVVAVDFPEPFIAVGIWYERFGQTSDEEVVDCLRLARQAPGGAEERWDGEWIEEGGGAAAGPVEETVAIPCRERSGGGTLDADLWTSPAARALVMFVHGSGSGRRSPRNRRVARALQRAGFATLLFDLLTAEEAVEDERTARFRFDLELLETRVRGATRWIAEHPRVRGLRLVYFGASTGAAAALAAAAGSGGDVAAVVSRGGRPDLVPADVLEQVEAPVLLLVGGRDEAVLDLNRSVLRHLRRAELVVVPGASHLFEEPGALEAVARTACEWLELRLGEPAATATVTHAAT